MIVVVAAIATLMAGACACADGGSSNCSCASCEGQQSCECTGGYDNTGGCCDGGCCDGWATDTLILYNTSDDFHHAMPSPGGSCCQYQRSYCLLWRPIAWLLHKFPVPPANLWGGAFGYVIGTSPCSPCTYQGNNWFINRLSFRTSVD